MGENGAFSKRRRHCIDLRHIITCLRFLRSARGRFVVSFLLSKFECRIWLSNIELYDQTSNLNVRAFLCGRGGGYSENAPRVVTDFLC